MNCKKNRLFLNVYCKHINLHGVSNFHYFCSGKKTMKNCNHDIVVKHYITIIIFLKWRKLIHAKISNCENEYVYSICPERI